MRDLAIVRLTPEGIKVARQVLKVQRLPFLRLGDSDATIQRGAPVCTYGFPLGQHLLKRTSGIISGPQVLEDGQIYVQIDAPINPGNSGGPLLNSAGEVIAVNTSGVPSAQNIGFGIPINAAKCLFDDMMRHSIVERPSLGLYSNHATDYQAQYLGNPVPSGLYIFYVESGSIGDRAGVQSGDMLYAINGYQIDEFGDTQVEWASEKISIQEVISRFVEGQQVTFLIWRAGERLELTATCEAPPRQARSEVYTTGDCEVLGGATFMDLVKNHFRDLPKNSYLLQYMRPEYQNESAVVVSDLIPGTEIAEVGGIYPGAIITEVNEVPVKTLSDLRRALLKSAKTGAVSFKLINHMFTVFSLEVLLENQKELARERICPITPAVGQLIAQTTHYEKKS